MKDTKHTKESHAIAPVTFRHFRSFLVPYNTTISQEQTERAENLYFLCVLCELL